MAMIKIVVTLVRNLKKLQTTTVDITMAREATIIGENMGTRELATETIMRAPIGLVASALERSPMVLITPLTSALHTEHQSLEGRS